MSRQYKTGLIITGDASGGIRAIQATDQELGKLNQGFDRGRRHQRDYADQSRATGQALDQLRRLAAPVGAALAGMFAGRALQQQIDFGDQLHKTNLRIGASVEALSQYNYVAQLSGVQFSQLTTAWQRQTRRIAEAARGTGEASAALEALNLNAGELSRLAPEEQFERIAEALQGVSEESERVALAQKVWDSDGVSLLQITNQGTDAIRAMREEADRLGLTINQATAESMSGLNDEMARLQAVATGVSRQVLAELVPAMTSALQATSQLIDSLGGAERIFDAVRIGATGLAAVMAGRYVGAFAASTAAKLAATRQAVLYQAALARMAGVSATAAASQTALAAATRGAAGALALIGGPGGAAVIAGLAIYHFREELGLVPRTVEASADAVAELTEGLYDLNRAGVELRLTELKQELDDVRAKAAEAAEGVVSAERQARQSINDIWVSGTTGQADAYDQSAAKQAQRDLQEFRAEVEETQPEVANLEAAIEQWEARLEQLNNRSSETSRIVRGSGAASREAAQASREAAQAAEQQARALEELRNRLAPGRRETIQLARDMNTLSLAFASGRLQVGEFIALQSALASSMIEPQEEARELADVTHDTVDEMSRAWERASDDIDRAFADAFAGAFDSFEDFADRLQSAFQRLLAELAYQATLRPIVVGFTSDLGGMMGIPGMGGQVGGFGQTLAGFQGGGMGMAMGNAWRAFQGTGSTYAGMFGSELAVQTEGGLRAGFNSFASSGFGSAALNIGGGLAGNLIGGELFGRSQEQQIGSTLGSVAGGAMAGKFLAGLGSFAGPLGTLAGGVLGSALGSMFGSGKKDYHFDFVQGEQPGVFGDRESALGKFGISRFSDFKRGEQQDQLNDLMTSIAEFDNALASVSIPERVDQMRESIEGFTHSGPDDLFEKRLRAIIDGSGAIAEEALLKITDAEALGKAFQGALRLESIGQGLSEELMAGAERWIEQAVGTDGFGAALSSMVDAAAAAHVLTQASDRLGIQFDDTASSAIHVASKMQSDAGGVENLAAIYEGYYQSMFSETERLSHSAEDMVLALGGVADEVPSSVEAYRELVSAQDLATESGRETALALMAMGPAFAQTIQGIEQALESAYREHLGRDADSDGLAYWMDEVVSGSMTLEHALDAIANSAEAAAYAAGDAAEDVADSVVEMSDRMRDAIRDRERLEQRLAELTLTQSELRSRELDGLTEMEAVKVRQVHALEDEVAAAQASVRAAEELARSEQRMIEQREALTWRLMELEEGEQAVREAQLAAMDPSLAAQQERIWALEDEIAALESATDAAEAAADAIVQISESANWLQEAGDGLGLTASNLQSMIEEVVRESEDAAQARATAAARAEEQIYNGLASAMVGQVTQVVMQSIVAPMAANLAAGAAGSAAAQVAGGQVAATAMATGGVMGGQSAAEGGSFAAQAMAAGGAAAGQAVAQGGQVAAQGLAGIVSQATSMINAMGRLLRDSDFQAAIGDVAGAIGDITGAIYNVSPAAGTAIPQIDAMSDSMSRAGSAARSAGSAARSGAEDSRDAEAIERQRRQLELEIMRLQGEESRALALERQYELEAMDASLHALQERAWRLRDEAEAERERQEEEDRIRAEGEARWRELRNQSANMERRLLQLTGDSAALLAWERNREREQLDELLVPTQERIWALEDELDALEAAQQAARDWRRELDSIGDTLSRAFGSISQWIDRLMATEQAPQLNLEAAGEQFARQLVLAEQGDRDALQSITRYADQYLAAGEAMFASGSGFQQIQSDVLAALEQLPDAISAEQFLADEIRQALQDTIGALPGGIEQAIAPLFDEIDISGDGLIDYDEFRQAFDGLATDSELQRIFDELDTNGDGTLTRLGAIAAYTGETDDNTKPIDERAQQQLDELQEMLQSLGVLTGEMAYTGDAIARLNEALDFDFADAIWSMRFALEDIAALARMELRSAEYEQAAGAAMTSIQQGFAQELAQGIAPPPASALQHAERNLAMWESRRRAAGGMLPINQQWQYQAALAARDQAQQDYDQSLAQSYRPLLGAAAKAADEWQALGLDPIDNGDFARQDSGTYLHLPTYRSLVQQLNRHFSDEGISARLDAAAVPTHYALGGVFTNGIVDRPTRFAIGEMGEAGPEAIMPLTRHSDGSLGVRAELPPLPPLLGQGDVVEVLQDLKRENQQLRRDLNRVLGNIEQHGAASVQVQQAGFKRSIAEQQRGNAHLDDMATAARLESSR